MNVDNSNRSFQKITIEKEFIAIHFKLMCSIELSINHFD